MRVLRYVLVATVIVGGVGCIVLGIDWLNPPDRGRDGMYYAVGDAVGASLGFGLIVLGALILCTVLVGFLVVGRRARDPKQPDGAPEPPHPPPSPLPEARAHFRPPDERSGK